MAARPPVPLSTPCSPFGRARPAARPRPLAWCRSCALVFGLVPTLTGAMRQRSAAAGSPAGTWVACALEGGALAGGRVRFGWGAASVEATLPAGAACSVASFGTDPAPGIRKVCECIDGNATSQQVRDELGVMWALCAVEGQECGCPSRTIRFGIGSRWIVSKFEGQESTFPCASSSFHGADPAQEVGKECWCEQGSGHTATAGTAIVMLSRHPSDLHAWLRYHLDYAQVQHVFLDVEDTPEFNSTWSKLSVAIRQRVTLWYGTPANSRSSEPRPRDDYESLQARQVAAMRRAKAEAAGMGIEWLVHIDDDELLYAPSGRRVGEVFAALPKDFSQAFIPNVEAVYDSASVQSCFSETSRVNVNPMTFASYANGKAAVRVADADASPAGPHMWRTSWGPDLPSLHLSKEPFGSPLLVVHFESCPFTRWEDKFWELGNTSPEKISAIPFRFYQDSILRMQECRGETSSQTSWTQDCSQDSLKRFWSTWKTTANPSLRSFDLMPLQIPWAEVLGAESP
mmetsp:Transcript_84855/g.248726  ORF Transcript_84855/g.248726 Transcript_84855/m.248726 type:complete len:515 (+) Transcript_84855:93-1637(+)